MSTLAEAATRHLTAGVTDLGELSRLVGAELGREVNPRTLRSYRSQFRSDGPAWLRRDNERCASWRSDPANRRRHVELTPRWQQEVDPVAYAWAQMRKRTREQGLPPVTVTKEELAALCAPMSARSPACRSTGRTGRETGRTRGARAPTGSTRASDTPGNVRVVCFAANALLNSFGLDAVLPLAREALARRAAGLPRIDRASGEALLAVRREVPGAGPRRSLAGWIRTHRKQKRSKRSSRLPFTITAAWVESELRCGTCAATGLLLVHRHPMLRPSIDRVDSSLGYTEENCRVVCHLANLGKAEWDDGVLWRVLDGMVRMPGLEPGRASRPEGF